MEKTEKLLVNQCSPASVRPIMMDLPYPPTQVRGRNQSYADLLSIDYCGAVSELSTIAQYINNQNRLSCGQCSMAQTILGIAMAEMIHLQKLGELIFLLGGNIDFVARHQNGQQRMWTPAYLTIPEKAEKMIWAGIEGEKAAISQYRIHMNRIEDDCVKAMLARIIKDEEYHIMVLQALLEEA